VSQGPPGLRLCDGDPLLDLDFAALVVQHGAGLVPVDTGDQTSVRLVDLRMLLVARRAEDGSAILVSDGGIENRRLRSCEAE